MVAMNCYPDAEYDFASTVSNECIMLAKIRCVIDTLTLISRILLMRVSVKHTFTDLWIRCSIDNK